MTRSATPHLVECPRDAMQGLHDFIPTQTKIDYLNQLLQVGFDTLDFGSFVSPKAIPQMRDTAEVLEGLDLSTTQTQLLAIVANERGAQEAAQHAPIRYLGFPLSLSETFQQRNTNRSIAEAFQSLEAIQQLCQQSGKELVTYISMGFGNPYGDPYSLDEVAAFVERLHQMGVGIVSLSDTIGTATEGEIRALFGQISGAFPQLEIGVHLHSRYADVAAKTRAAWEAGCRRIDGALKGLGGCPMAKDELVGNMATEEIVRSLDALGVPLSLDREALQLSLQLAASIFPPAH
ncbi:hydroxymethylglutaryl-CoA lyase [Cesiribacter andamanensis]|uniref:Hydroxymethylglutaryl-CoA lyase yngG n=1 Tax=Cesiribacter andamanensis AMV16 TaxID=1279009 RepID=M7NBH7_9BACT|nr:hydroxymethylglutaryl-CoA lyase [Cesiribacter andamanensis]EMR04617.1 Hydroxymethylglutaryl-CoA lyase yngG [Cesiribacter andamanensis AMV16]